LIPECAVKFMSNAKNPQDGPGVQPVWDQNQPAWDETRRRGMSGLLRGISGADWLLYAAVAGVALLIGIVNALSTAQEAARRGGAYDASTPLLWEMSSIGSIILVAPVLFLAVRRMRDALQWYVRLGLAVAAVITFSTLHIIGMVGIRKTAMMLVGGSYNFQFSLGTIVYEFRKDLVTCLLIGGALWLIDSRREAQRLRAATMPGPEASPQPHMVWLRDGSTRIRIEPRDIVWISSAGNYIEYSMAGGTNPLVRGTLAAAETQLKPFNIVRVHRTRLANLNRVTAMQAKPSGDFELTFDTGRTIQGSRRYRDAVASLDSLGQSSASA
jgi:hypothetical protein